MFRRIQKSCPGFADIFKKPETAPKSVEGKQTPDTTSIDSEKTKMCCLHEHAGAGVTNSPREVLPATVKPVHYHLEITPDLKTFKFKGVVDIELKVNETIKEIVLNANELEVNSASVTFTHTKTTTTLTPTSISLDKSAETLTLAFPHEIPAGSTATLHIVYTGIHNDAMAGFYRSSYTENGEKKHMVVTQFEATDARRALPCWDEPNLKATFDVTLNIDRALTALSNMDVKEEKDTEIDGLQLKTVKFNTTPIMSTYLLAMAVGDLEYIETSANPTAPSDAKPLTVRVYTLKGHKEQGRFALDVCARTLEFFSEYFDIAYPLPKMDLIAIPDFSAGAMENWGLVTYREVYLLFDEKVSSAKAKQRIAYVVGHELAHQWFGNLVTMDWWSELWLNEGFATFVGWLAVDNLFPEWRVWTQFLIDDYTRGKDLDALRSSHPIDVDVKSPAEITQIFDAISYCKGASVIRMLCAFLGEENFKLGTRAYLKKHKFSNATTKDLWHAYTAQSNQDVATFMHAWTRDVGYPVIEVLDEKYDEEKKEMTLKLKQSRYLSSGDLKADEDVTTWWVPLGIVTHLNPRAPSQHILSQKEDTVTFPYDSASNAYWKLNFSTTGFYRVRLSEKQLSSLASVIKTNIDTLTTEDRVGVLADAFALALAGYGSTVGALELLKSFEAEEDYIVLDELANRLKTVIAAWYREPKDVSDGLKKIMRQLFAPKVTSYGYEYPANEDHLTSLKRTLVIESAASADEPSVIAELQSRFKAFMGGDDSALPPNLRGVAYRVTLQHTQNPTEDFEAVMKTYKTASTADQRLAALYALGAVNDPALINRVVNEVTLDTELVRPQDAFYPLRGLSKENPSPSTVRPQLWEFSTSNWTVLHERYGPTLGLLAAMLTVGFADQVGQDVIAKVEAWLAGEGLTEEEKAKRNEQMKLVKMPVEQSLEKVRGVTRWVERERESVKEWVAKQ